jgi:hypothetical protein
MEKRRAFSHSLLYSVAPENFSSLHLNDEDAFCLKAYESHISANSFVQTILNFFRITAAKPCMKRIQKGTI